MLIFRKPLYARGVCREVFRIRGTSVTRCFTTLVFAGLLGGDRLCLGGGVRDRSTQSDALPYAGFFGPTLPEIFYGLRFLVLLRAPLLVSLVKVRLRNGLVGAEHAHLAHEALEHVRLRPVGPRGSLDRRRRSKPVLVPLDAAHDGPRQHARQLLASFSG